MMKGARSTRGIPALLFLLAGMVLAPFQGLAEPQVLKPDDRPLALAFSVRESEGAPGAGLEDGTGYAPYDGGFLKRRGAAGGKFDFRAEFVLASPPGDRALALFMGPGDYPRDVWLNGVQIAKTGSHGERYNSTIYYSSRVLLPPSLLELEGKPNVLVIEAFPVYEASPLGTLSIGGFDDVSLMVFVRNFFNINLVQAALVLALVEALFFAFLFLRSPTRDLRYLWCSLMCLSFALGYSNMSFYNEAFDDVSLDKASRTGLVLTSVFLSFFAMNFTGLGARRRWVRPAILLPALAASAWLLFLPDKQTLANFFSSVTTNLVLTPLLLLTLVLFVIGFAKRRDAASFAVLAGFFVTIAASVHDIYYITIHVTPFCWLVAYGYMALLVSIFFVLALEQARISIELAEKTGRLNERNRVLGEMLDDLGKVTEGLLVASADFDQRIGGSLEAAHVYARESVSISATFRSQMKSIDEDIGRAAERLAQSSERVPKAIASQTRSVEGVNATLAAMKDRIEENLATAEESSRLAETLAADAGESARVIDESRRAIAQAAEHSGSLQGVLASIENIAERTHVLSINAAIESARLGSEGRGFGVVAQEIRKLADQSRESLRSSFAKIEEMTGAVTQGSSLSEEAASTLRRIMSAARESADRTGDISRLIRLQKEQGAEILGNAAEVLEEIRVLSELSSEDARGTAALEARLREIKDTLASVAADLEGLEAGRKRLFDTLDGLRGVMEDNRRHIDALRRSMDRARA